jgi:hypothetical protein
MQKIVNLFYEEPDPDRWIKYDRYPRRIIRRIFRGSPIPGGQQTISINLIEGFKRLGVKFRFNDYKFINSNSSELACVIGKPHVLEKINKNVPVVYGAAIFSHPSVDVNFLVKYPNIKLILLPGNWMKTMFEPFFPGKVAVWPVGIDTSQWFIPRKTDDYVLIYYKIRWDNFKIDHDIFFPILNFLEDRGIKFIVIKYGKYQPETLFNMLTKCKAAIFLCEHETQGIAYQQILSTETPIFAWDRGGVWTDPSFYPEIHFGPVSSVPYWSNMCGEKFSDFKSFKMNWEVFDRNVNLGMYTPRNYILNNLSLEICTNKYIEYISKYM